MSPGIGPAAPHNLETKSMIPTTSIVSIGQACCHLQQMPEVVRRAAAELHVVPVARLNFVDHYSESDVERIAAHLRRQAGAV